MRSNISRCYSNVKAEKTRTTGKEINQTFNSYLDEMSILDNYYGEGKSIRDKITELEEENRKQKLHIEAKDKAYTALLKDYEELKEKNKEMKAEIEQRLNAIRDLHIRY